MCFKSNFIERVKDGLKFSYWNFKDNFSYSLGKIILWFPIYLFGTLLIILVCMVLDYPSWEYKEVPIMIEGKEHIMKVMVKEME